MKLDFCTSCGMGAAHVELIQHVLRPDLEGDGQGHVEVTLCRPCWERVSAPRLSSVESYYTKLELELTRYLEESETTPTWQAIADELNNKGWLTVSGSPWTASSVFKVFERLGIDRTRKTIEQLATVPLPLVTGD